MHEHDLDLSLRIRRVLATVAAVLAACAAVGVLVLRPREPVAGEANRIGVSGPTYDAAVEIVERDTCVEAESPEARSILEPVCTQVTFRVLEGADRGERFSISMPDSPTTPDLIVDDKIVVARQDDAEPEFRYAFVDRQREPVLLWLAVVFSIAVVVLGRLRGLAALAGLGASIVVLLMFILPAILAGGDPVLVAVVGSAVIAYLALYLAHGFSAMTTVALLGTLASLALTAVLAQLFVGLAQLSGFASEEAIVVRLFSDGVGGAGLVLAGIVIGAMGALDDVTVTQASAVWELKAANPALRARELYRSGLRIGRDHVASTVNTLLLAYAGASLPLLIFFVLSEQPLVEVANQEVVATEIIRTLVGSIGLVASVPITTWLAARVATGSGAEHLGTTE